MNDEMTPGNQLIVDKLGKDDLPRFVELIGVFEEVFEMDGFSIPDTSHLRQILSRPDFMAFVAVIGNRVVGGLTSYILEQYYSKKQLAYVYDLAVSTKWQRRGIGRQLIVAINEFCQESRMEEVFVQVYKVDDYAIDFYRKTNPSSEEPVVHFSYILNK